MSFNGTSGEKNLSANVECLFPTLSLHSPKLQGRETLSPISEPLGPQRKSITHKSDIKLIINALRVSSNIIMQHNLALF